MPTKPLSPCPVPGCPVLSRGRCEDHRIEARRASDAKRPSAAQRGYGTTWRTTRAKYLRSHTMCEHPGCRRLATEVDHVDNLGPLGPRGHDPFNLQGLCASHHAQKTAAQTPGGWNAR